MKTTIYTIADADCPHCVSAKNYLKEKGVQFEEKNVAEKREYLAEMLQISNKFAGVPVTVVVKDDGSQEVLKGFTETDYAKALTGTAPIEPAQTASEGQVSATDAAPTPQVMPSTPPLASTDAPKPDISPEPIASDDQQEQAKQKINDVLSSLEQKTAPATPSMPQTPVMPLNTGIPPVTSETPTESAVTDPLPDSTQPAQDAVSDKLPSVPPFPQ